ncbi:hypothetical protein BU26DRAFT_116885 [Trematosphaeria pertusa]|uniref:Uncharacterized protein n=1 Tax=Trematosphaeria pertusa TaxID=390896 RepID=A0A6A6I072_9PLEO|nr:uncharacterized protein BU26DRAFT_116885 [Trematosphaeria pertusa]KAF2243372.1 hypothetical protein BU26DRAFT_116885 [Trematosphaeria pertusa]
MNTFASARAPATLRSRYMVFTVSCPTARFSAADPRLIIISVSLALLHPASRRDPRNGNLLNLLLAHISQKPHSLGSVFVSPRIRVAEGSTATSLSWKASFRAPYISAQWSALCTLGCWRAVRGLSNGW